MMKGLTLTLAYLFLKDSCGLSNKPPPSSQSASSPRSPRPQTNFENDDSFDGFGTRRDLLWKLPLGGVVTYSYGRLLYNVLSVQGIQYPEPHERRTEETLLTAFSAASKTMTDDQKNVFRVLEVGIGRDCRVSRRGLYSKSLKHLSQQGVNNVQFVGVDLKSPSKQVVDEARESLVRGMENGKPLVDLQFVQGSIEESMPFESGSFDCVVCCLTLCSVNDPEAAVREMKRVLRPSGGTLGYVEHVAVDTDTEPYHILDWQQRKLDRLQQVVADNCHLRRDSDKLLARILLGDDDDNNGNNNKAARVLNQERFVVDGMWPVSMQSCGVLQRQKV